MPDFDSLFSEAETRRLELAFQSSDKPASRLRVSEAEELAWFNHQQRGDASGQQALAWRLSGIKHAGRLISAVEALIREVPGLNVHYCFNDQLELVKQPGNQTLSPVTLFSVANETQAINAVLKVQAQPMNLEQQTPLQTLVLIGPDCIYLAFIRHQVLAASHAWQTLLTALSALYNGEPLPLHSALSVEMPDSLADNGPLRLPWKRQAFAVQTTAPGFTLDTGSYAAANVARSLLPDDKPALISQLALRFGQFIAAQAGGQPVQLRVPLATATSGFASQASVRLTIKADTQENEIQRLASQTLNNDLAQLEIRWQEDLTALQLEGVDAESLLLPPLYTACELSLVISQPDSSVLRLELLADPRLSLHAAPFLLEQFVAYLAGDVAINLQLTAATASPQRMPQPNKTEPAIAKLILHEFREALAAPDMQADEDFFDRGGHSLVATRVIGRLLSGHQIEVNINDLFNHPTANALSGYAQQRAAQKESRVSGEAAADDGVKAPLSLAQQSLWKVYEAFDHNDIFNLPFAIRFLDEVDESALRQAFIDVMVRHSVLRSLFINEHGVVLQHVVEQAELADFNWFSFSDETAVDDVNAALAKAGEHRFDLTRELPLRATLLRDAASGQQLLSLLFHHITLDEWSLNLLMDELGQAYAFRVAGEAPLWREQPPQFYQFANQQRAAGVQQEHLDYWLDALRGAPLNQQLFNQQAVSDLSVAAHADVEGGWLEFSVQPEIAAALYKLARRNNASLFNAVYAAITSALNLLGGPDDMLIGTSMSGRNDATFFDTIGYFTTVVVHRLRFNQQLTVSGLLNQVRQTINDSLPYSDIPVDLVEEGLFGVDADRKNHMFEVFIQIHSRIKLNGEFTLHDGRRLAYRQVEPEKTGSLLGLQFEVLEEHIEGVDTLRVMMTYRTDHYTSQQAQLIAQTIQQVFAHFAVAEDSEPLLIDLPPASQN